MKYITLLLCMLTSPAFACEGGHWVKANIGRGEIIELEDGTLYRVDSMDTLDTGLWLPLSDITLCDDEMINTDDGEKAGVTPILK